jgi:hypothetical protein
MHILFTKAFHKRFQNAPIGWRKESALSNKHERAHGWDQYYRVSLLTTVMPPNDQN